MTVERQRFCPVCDRAFNEGEPVLRCEGCGVVHHPACWVRNGGCYTGGEHQGAPHPEAYEIGPALRAGSAAAPAASAPREQPPTPEALATRRRVIVDPVVRGGPPPRPALDDEPVIGRVRPNVTPPSQPAAPPPVATPPRRVGRPAPYAAKKSDPGMPRIYTHRRILGYWYVPAAGVVAIAVAWGVVWAADRLFGGDGEPEAVVATTPTATATTPPGTTATPTPPFSVQTASAGETPPTRDPSLKFAPGDRARVVETGDCLNVRVGPGLQNDAIVCLPDGSEVTVLGGPQGSDGFSWWQVDTPNNLGQGWAAEDYLERIE